MQNLNHVQIGRVGTSKQFPETDERAYFDTEAFTSDTTDTEERIVHTSEHQSIAEQITNGVRVLDSHKHETNGLGQTNLARIENNKVPGSFYIFKGMEINGNFTPMPLDDQSYPTTEAWIMGLKDGFIKSVSMGWYAERNICNICQGTIYQYPCYHYPGETYNITNKETGEESIIKATFTCYGITVVEISLVYFPANPDARLIAKAKALASDNHLSSEQIDRIETKLETAIINTERSYFDMPLTPEDKTEIAGIIKTAIAETTNVTTAAPPVTQAATGMVTVTDSQGNVRSMPADQIPATPVPATAADITAAIQPLADKVDTLEQSLAAGESASERKTADDENVEQYNRVKGKEGDEKAHRAFLETLPDIASVEIGTKEYKDFADEKFGSTGRKTEGILDELEGEENSDDPNESNPDRL